MSLVVDSSLLVAALVDTGREGRWAEEMIASGDLVAPDLVYVETTNVLRRLEASGVLETAEAGAATRDLLGLDVELVPFHPFAERIWELRRNLTSYDAWYVAVAERFDLALATLDHRLARAPGVGCTFRLPE